MDITRLLRPITVRVGANFLYPRLQHLYPDKYPLKTPSSGIELTVQYADTAVDRDKSKAFDKTILAIHGTPGYLTHFDQLLQHYRTSERIRVIVPNLPDFAHTRSSGNVFWHTVPEKVSFLKSFLAQLGVSRVDCLVAHSMGFQSVSGLFENVSLAEFFCY